MKQRFSSINLLDELQDEEYRQLCTEFTPVRFRRGQLIYTPGNDADLVFVIREGRLRLYLAMEDKEFFLTHLGPGDLYATHTRAHVLAIEDVTILTMPTERFHQYMVTHHALSRTIISILGKLLSQSFSIIDNLVFKDISGRLADFLFHEAEHSGQRNEQGIVLNLDLTMEQLAAVIGSSRQTVSTIINGMQRAGVITKIGRGVFLVPNLDLLRNFPVV